MIFLIHQNNSVLKILNEDLVALNFSSEKPIAHTLFSLAHSYPEELIVWCNKVFFDSLNHDELERIFHHHRIIASWSVERKGYIPPQIGYVEDSPFIKINYNVPYPTWNMSADVGGVYAKVLNAVVPEDFTHNNFDYFLVSFAKSLMPEGLLCYSDNRLLLQNTTEKVISKEASSFTYFKFIKEHYKFKWVFIAFFCKVVYEKKINLGALLLSFFYSDKRNKKNKISEITIKSTLPETFSKKIDVIIPTIGRKEFLLDVLTDLSHQTLLPIQVIIVEQNPDPYGVSDLDFLTNKDWPFIIVHHFIHQTGACNARNLAISETQSDWVFFADDDNRLRPETLEQALSILSDLGAKAITSSYLQKEETKRDLAVRQWLTFGAGNSFIQGDIARSIDFDLSYEHGYGEDMDYGMRLRNIGVDVIYHPFDILHLKAPVGGFRKPIEKPWEVANEIPKPSPTIMLFRRKHTTERQLKGYKLLFFIRYYRKQNTKNPIAYFKKMQSYWNTSIHWSKKLDSL